MPALVSRRLGAQYANCRLQRIDSALQLGLAKRHCLDANLVNEPLEFARPERDAEELHSEVRNLVCFIENDDTVDEVVKLSARGGSTCKK